MKISKRLGVIAGIVAAFSPLAAFAAFTDGMVVPAGTTTNATTSITSYFFPTIMATVFQSQVIDLIVIVAAVMVAWYIVRSVWHRLKMHH